MNKEPAAKSQDLAASELGGDLLEALEKATKDVFEMTVTDFNQAVMAPSNRSTKGESHSGTIEIPSPAGGLERVEINTEACVSFDGPISGHVVLSCSLEGGNDIARGLLMMGDDESLVVDEVDDALGECVNMIAGSLKTRALDPHGEFQLGLPELRHGGTEGFGQCKGACVYQLFDGPVAVGIWITSPEEPTSAD